MTGYSYNNGRKSKVLLISSGNDGVDDDAIDKTVITLKLYLKTLERRLIREGYFYS